MSRIVGIHGGSLATGPVAFVELEEPDRMERSVRRTPKPVYELTAADRPLVAVCGRR
jgi:hypothetical protein